MQSAVQQHEALKKAFHYSALFPLTITDVSLEVAPIQAQTALYPLCKLLLPSDFMHEDLVNEWNG